MLKIPVSQWKVNLARNEYDNLADEIHLPMTKSFMFIFWLDCQKNLAHETS